MNLKELIKKRDELKLKYEEQLKLREWNKNLLPEEEFTEYLNSLNNLKKSIEELDKMISLFETYSEQYEYERIMAISDMEFEELKKELIKEEKKKQLQQIEENNKRIDALKITNQNLSQEVQTLQEQINKIKHEYLSETNTDKEILLNKAKTIKTELDKKVAEIAENSKEIDNHQEVEIEDFDIDIDTYKQTRIKELTPGKYQESFEESDDFSRLLLKTVRSGKTPKEISEALNRYFHTNITAFSDPIYELADLAEIGQCEPDFPLEITKLLEKYFTFDTEYDTKIGDKAIVGINDPYESNDHKTGVTKVQLLKYLINGERHSYKGSAYYVGPIREGDFLNLQDRISLQKERLDAAAKWEDQNEDLLAFAKEYFIKVSALAQYKYPWKENIDRFYRYAEGNKDKIQEIIGAATTNVLLKDLGFMCDKYASISSITERKEKLTNKRFIFSDKRRQEKLEELNETIDMLESEIAKIYSKYLLDLNSNIAYTNRFISKPCDIFYSLIDTDTYYETDGDIFTRIKQKDMAQDTCSLLNHENKKIKELEIDLELAKKFLKDIELKENDSYENSVKRLAQDFGVDEIDKDTMFDINLEKARRNTDKPTISEEEVIKLIDKAKVLEYFIDQRQKAKNNAEIIEARLLGFSVEQLRQSRINVSTYKILLEKNE